MTHKGRQFIAYAMLTVFCASMGASVALQNATNNARAFVAATDADNVRETIVRLNWTRSR